MKTIIGLLATVMAAAIVPSAASAATYVPVGPQTNVALSTVTNGGWTLCYSATFAQSLGSSASQATAGCTGDQLMLAARQTGSDTLLALAWAPKVDALFNTGQNASVTHTANGTQWYNADNFSWGFAPVGQSVGKNQCDAVSGSGRICLHTIAGVGGYRVNDVMSLNGSTDFEKLVFSSSSIGAVPEPASWAMMILGMGAIGYSLRSAKRRSNAKFDAKIKRMTAGLAA